MWECICQWVPCIVHGTYYLFECPNFSLEWHYQWVPCTVHGTHKPLFSKTFIKNGFHGTFYTFKNYFAIVFSVFSFRQKISKRTLSICLDCVFGCVVFAFSFFIYLFIYWEVHFMWECVCQWVLCFVYGTHNLFECPNSSLEWHCQWVPCTIHRTHKPLFSAKLSLKMGLTVLFTHLKIVLLQCFQQNKRYLNGS